MIFHLIGDLLKALAQLRDRRFRKVVWLGVALTLALLIGLYGAVLGAIQIFLPDTVILPFIGEISGLAALLSVGSLVVMLVLSPFLMIPVASAFTGLFLDDIAAAVEARHYPHLPAPPPVPLWQSMLDAAGFFGLLVAVNALALLAYPLAGPLTPLIFWAVNGYLLGREYFQIAAMRWLGRRGARARYRNHRGEIWLGGLLMVAPLTIPVVNLFVPVLGAAAFTHLLHRRMPRGTA